MQGKTGNYIMLYLIRTMYRVKFTKKSSSDSACHKIVTSVQFVN